MLSRVSLIFARTGFRVLKPNLSVIKTGTCKGASNVTSYLLPTHLAGLRNACPMSTSSHTDNPVEEIQELLDDTHEQPHEDEPEVPTSHIPLSGFQRSLLAVGTGLASFFDPTRAENIAVFGEVTAAPVLDSLREKMLSDPEAADILREKPRINSRTINLDYLATLPEDTLGGHYIAFLRRNNVTPDSRLPVRFIDDPELAYVMQRYREVHDLVHAVTGQPTNMLGEVVVKWIEGIQTGLPMCVTGGLFGATRLRPKQRQKFRSTHLNWAVKVGLNSRPFLNIYYERRWEQPMTELREHISPYLNQSP